MDRRTFLSWVGVGFLASSLPVAIAACSSDTATVDTTETPEGAEPPAPPPEAIAREDGFVAIGPVQALESDGFLKGDVDDIAVIVTTDPADPAQYLAVGSTCPHQQCNVDWKSETTLFECPCHGSKFNPDGSVANGPAAEPLPVFEAKVEEDVVLVKTV